MDWNDQQAEAGPSRLPYTDGNGQGDASMVDAGDGPVQELRDEEQESGQQEEGRNSEEEVQGDQDAEMMTDDAAPLPHAPAAVKAALETAGAHRAKEGEHAARDVEEEPPIPHTKCHQGGATMNGSTVELRQHNPDAPLHADVRNGVNGAGHVEEQRSASRFARPFYPKKWHAQRIQEQQQQERRPSLTGAHGEGLPAENAQPSTPATALPDFVPRYQLRGHRKTISCVRISPDGELLATAGESRSTV